MEQSPCSSSPVDIHIQASSMSASRSKTDLRIKPTFDQTSRESLLSNFRSMLTYFPFITLSPEVSIRELTLSQPVVLLAILSATSSLQTPGTRSSYDAEFTKELAIRYVTNGERTLELLQGILIYCAWYPFHLRPKSRHVLQYLRMATDIILELELDSSPRIADQGLDLSVLSGEQQLSMRRAYLAFFYLASSFVTIWGCDRGIRVSWNSWTARNCELLQLHGSGEGDRILATQARLAGLLLQTTEMRVDPIMCQSNDERRAMFNLVKSELMQIESSLPSGIASAVTIRQQIIFIATYLDIDTVLNMPEIPFRPSIYGTHLSTDLNRCLGSLSTLYNDIMTLDETHFICFTFADWLRPIMGTRLGIRLSCMMSEYPEHDDAWGRLQLNLDKFLLYMSQDCREKEASVSPNQMNIVSASCAIMRTIHQKYRMKVMNLEQSSHDSKLADFGCPIFDGSLDGFLPLWDAQLSPLPLKKAGIPWRLGYHYSRLGMSGNRAWWSRLVSEEINRNAYLRVMNGLNTNIKGNMHFSTICRLLTL
ncbi:hypothetical protein BGZ63DRAFT_397914 [Mariannaea sp. PMI_226]|nr:hypothetical protein BGZ63DRAFT_397914 [Mariannaea sp. PMI_226]